MMWVTCFQKIARTNLDKLATKSLQTWSQNRGKHQTPKIYMLRIMWTVKLLNIIILKLCLHFGTKHSRKDNRIKNLNNHNRTKWPKFQGIDLDFVILLIKKRRKSNWRESLMKMANGTYRKRKLLKIPCIFIFSLVNLVILE